NFTCCPEINLGNDTSFCLNSFSLPLDVTTINATYKWQDGSTNSSFSVNGAGDYWVIVTVNNCSDTDSISVVQTSNLSFTLGPDTAVCPGQNVTLEPTTSISNATYNWNNGGGTSPTFITNTAGQVTVEITNQSGCVGRDTIQIINDNPLTIDLGVDLVTCFGDSIKLELSPPRENLNYSWNIGGTLISSDSSIMVGTLGTIPYVLNVDSANCTASDAITVTVYALPTVSLGNDTFLCANANSNIVLDAGSGQTDYIWSQGGTTQTITINSVNEYSVIVTDANLCQATDTILVVVQSPNTIDIGPDQTMCPGGTIQIDLDNVNLNEAGASWVWVNDNSTGPNYLVQNLNAGDTATVIINYTNTFGCVSADSSLVTINQNLQIVGLSDLIPCERETATLTTPVNANYSYSWFIGGILTATPAPNNVLSIPALVANDIISVQLQITDNVLGCAGDTTITITVNPIPKPVLSDVNICSGVQTTLDPALAPPYTFYWTENGAPMTPLSSTTQTITGSSAGSVTYNVQVTDPTTSCSNDTFAVVTTRPPPAYTLSDLTPTVICEGRQKTLSTGMDTSLYTHLWTKGGVSISNSDNTIFITESDTYKVTVTEKSSSCAQGSNIAIQYIPPPVVDLNIANNFDLCDESEVSLKNLNYNPAIQSLWSTGAVNVEEIIITQFGVYWLKESVGACSDSDGVVILHRELPLSGLGPDTALCFDDLFSKQMTLDTKQNTGSHLWSTGDTSRSIQISIPGLYSVLITSEYGCITDDEIVVLEHCLPNLWVPNVFSPNGDGKNDYWSPVMKNLDDVELWVYNRWGEQIWKGNSQESAWDGKYKNRPVAQDVYVWKISYSFYDELQTKTKKTRVGIVTIIR
ncbi:MAG: gliding motility-associated-like protein, partial [Saprospiraceae bacterium]